jgi:phenylacetate-CoA ligase
MLIRETLATAVMVRHLRRAIRQDEAAVAAERDRLLCEMVRHAYGNVPFYRRLWSGGGFDPKTFRGTEDLHRIPIARAPQVKAALAAGELRPRGLDLSQCGYLESSGSSGVPSRFYRGPSEERIRRAVGLHIWREHGFGWRHPTAQFQILPGSRHFLQRLGIAPKTWIGSALPMPDQLELFMNAQPDVVAGTATALRGITRAIESAGKSPPRPRLVICAGELADATTRDLVRRVLGTEIVALYGMTEVGYVAWQCERRSAMHVNPLSHIVQIMRDGKQCADGEIGELVITDLHSRTTPFIRYANGDLATANTAPCPCGRAVPPIAAVEGRAKGCITLADGRILTTRQIVNHLAPAAAIGSYRIHQQTPKNFRIEAFEQWPQPQQARFAAQLSQLTGPAVILIQTAPPPPAESTGKTRSVISDVPPAIAA